MNKKVTMPKKLSYSHSTFLLATLVLSRKLRDRNSKESLVKGNRKLTIETYSQKHPIYNCSTYLIECNPLNKSAHFQTTGHALQCVNILRSARKASVYFS